MALELFVGMVLGGLLDRPALAQEEEQLYYGLLHAHTAFSDGTGLPADAYARARKKGLDFFAVTPHNHTDAEMGAGARADGLLIATQPSLYATPDGTVTYTARGETVTTATLTGAAARATKAEKFVGLYGQEFSTIGSGNHVNVLGPSGVIDAANGDFPALFAYLERLEERTVVQLNHPDAYEDLFYAGQDLGTKKKMRNDYGLDDVGLDFGRLVAEADGHVALIELLSGPAMRTERTPNYRYRAAADDYYFYLCQGFHVSPSVGHDNHYPTWGDTTDARMGVYAEGLTTERLFDAFEANRTFATEDLDLSLDLVLNGAERMGATVDLPAGAALAFEVHLADPSDDGTTFVSLVGGFVEPQAGTFTRLTERDGLRETVEVAAGERARFDGHLSSGDPEFYYVVVEQEDGDRAWSAPIWLGHPRHGQELPAAPDAPPAPDPFVWTRNASPWYHERACKAAASIKPENLESGTVAPAGRQKHACQLPATSPEP